MTTVRKTPHSMGRLNGTKFCTRKINSPSALPKMASEMEQPFFLAILTIKDACSLVTLPFVFAGAVAGSGHSTLFEIRIV